MLSVWCFALIESPIFIWTSPPGEKKDNKIKKSPLEKNKKKSPPEKKLIKKSPPEKKLIKKSPPEKKIRNYK